MMKSLSDKRIAIYGAGAVGSYIASKFIAHGINVDLVARGNQLSSLQKYGLTVTDKDNIVTNYKVSALSKLSGIYDIIFVTVKSKDTLEVALSISKNIADDGLVVSLQNGVENPTILSSIINPKNVVTSVIYVTAVLEGYGKIKYHSDANIAYNFYNKHDDPRIDLIDTIYTQSEIPHKKLDDIKTATWIKLIFNVVANPLTALFRYNYGQFTSDKRAKELAKKLYDEAVVAAEIMGVKIADNQFDIIIDACAKNAKFKSSMLQDIESNKKPEFDAILGAVKRVYKSKNMQCPYTDMLLDIMIVKYGGWFQSSPRLTADILVYHDNKILLIERKNEPFGYAIPGGFVDLSETVEEAAVRELEEETNVIADISELEMVGVYSKVDRDKRGRTVSVIYAYKSDTKATAGDDAKDAKYFNIDNLPENIAFDHRDAINDFLKMNKN